MNVLNFNSPQDMQAYLVSAQAEAHRSLHHAQNSITFGNYWVRFVDIANRVVEFGRVSDPAEIVELELTAGSTKREAARVVVQTRIAQENGFLYGPAFSLLSSEGEYGHTHKAHVWPIDESLFNAAAEAMWQMELMPVSAKINLNAAYIALRGHVRGEN